MATKPFVLPSGVDFYAGDGTAAGAADPLLVVSDSTNKVGINSQTPSGTLDINTASATDKGLIVRGSTSQTANLFEAQNVSSGILHVVDSAGKVGIITPTPTGTLDITVATASTKGIILRSATSQNANLLEYTDPTGAIYGYINSFGEYNPVGSRIGFANTFAAGLNAGRGVTSSGDPWGGDYATFIGQGAGFQALNTGFGFYAGGYAGQNSQGYGVVMIGAQAGASASGGPFSSATKSASVMIGWQAGYTSGPNYDMQQTVLIGNLAGSNVSGTNTYSTMIGYGAGANASGSNNLYIGNRAGSQWRGTLNVIVAQRVSDFPVLTGSRSTMIGLIGAADDSVYIGYTNGSANGPRGTGNVVIGGSSAGAGAAGHLMNGNYNILIGNEVSTYYGAGYSTHSSGLLGSSNIDIAPTNAYSNISRFFTSELATNINLSNKLNIARTVRGDISTKQVSIGNASLAPTATLDVISNSASRKGVIIQGAASQTANYFEVQSSAGTPLLAITASGSISGAISPTILATTSGITLTDEHHGDIIEYTGTAGSGTFTLGTNTQITIPSWNCMVVNVASGVIIASGTNTMRSPGALNKSRTQYSSISIYRRGTNDFMLGGDLA